MKGPSDHLDHQIGDHQMRAMAAASSRALAARSKNCRDQSWRRDRHVPVLVVGMPTGLTLASSLRGATFPAASSTT
jgi:hypothetical protein